MFNSLRKSTHDFRHPRRDPVFDDKTTQFTMIKDSYVNIDTISPKYKKKILSLCNKVSWAITSTIWSFSTLNPSIFFVHKHRMLFHLGEEVAMTFYLEEWVMFGRFCCQQRTIWICSVNGGWNLLWRHTHRRSHHEGPVVHKKSLSASHNRQSWEQKNFANQATQSSSLSST